MLTGGPCSPDAVQCTYSDCVRPSMTRRSPWSNVIREGTLPCARRTLNSTELPKLILTMSLGAFCGPNKGSLSLCQGIHDPEAEYRFKFTPVGISPSAHQCDKRGATLPHKPITPSQLALSVCGLTAAPRPHWYEHRQSCPGVTQAVLYVPRFIHSTSRWSRLAGNIQVLALPFSTQIPDRAVPHTFVQPIDCLMSNPYPGDTNWTPGTSGWREGVTTPPLPCLVPVPGCLLGSEPATCPIHRWPAENLPLPPPQRQEATLRPDRKPHLWNSSSPWDPVN